MMNFEQFKESIEILKNYNEYIDKLASLNIDIWETEEVGRFITQYINLIATNLNFEIDCNNSVYSNDFEYWVYELEYGAKVKEYFNPEEKEFEELGADLEKVYKFLTSR